MDSARQNEEEDLCKDCEGSKVENPISQEFTEKDLHEEEENEGETFDG